MKCIYFLSLAIFTGRHICLKKRHDLYDDWLVEIGKKKPLSLILEHCHGDHVTANGLRELFRDCADSLQVGFLAVCTNLILVYSLHCTFVHCTISTDKHRTPICSFGHIYVIV